MGYAEESRIPLWSGSGQKPLYRCTFITPDQRSREQAVRIKLGALRSCVEGRRVVMIDDSIVRGTTSRQIVVLLREAGATEVHMRISSPPFMHPCFFGTDVASRDKLIACRLNSVEEIAKVLDIPREEVVFAMDAIVDPVSLYEPVYSDSGDTICVMDQVRDSKNTDENWLEQIALREAIAKLSDREKKIMSLRYLAGKTQVEVAGEIGISQAQVSRLEKNALERIKKQL